MKLEYKWSDQQLTFLMRHARNDFSRWMRRRACWRLTSTERQPPSAGQPLSLPVHGSDAFRAILLDEKIDPALAAEILTCRQPTKSPRCSRLSIRSPSPPCAKRSPAPLANELADEFLAVYNANKLDSYRVEHADIGKRALRNTCLRYLAFAEPTLGDKLVATQYHQADNMTDALAALSAAVAAELPCRDALMQEYDDKWHQDGLVMDKWFIPVHQPGSQRGGNRARSAEPPFVQHEQPEPCALVNRRFRQQQPGGFHAEDGSGYQFLVEMLT